jgi:hypothetical protein
MRERAAIVAIVGVCCTPAPSLPERPIDAEANAPPTVAPTSKPEPAATIAPAAQPPTEAPPTGIAALVQDLAIIRNGGDLVVSNAQCGAGARWASDEETLAREGGGEPLRTGDLLHVITSASVERWTVTVEQHGVVVSPTAEDRSRRAGSLLASKTMAPSPAARLVTPKPSAVGKREAKLSAWLAKEVGFAVRPLARIEGSFGDQVDAVVVFTPKRAHRAGQYPEDSEVAVLVAGDVPKGWLRLGEPAEEDDELADGIFGIQVVGVVDLDGNGVEEILWLWQELSADAMFTIVGLSYFDGERFAVQQIGGCSYNGCDAFLPRRECRGVVAPRQR